MPASKKPPPLHRWRISLIKRTPAATSGYVEAIPQSTGLSFGSGASNWTINYKGGTLLSFSGTALSAAPS